MLYAKHRRMISQELQEPLSDLIFLKQLSGSIGLIRALEGPLQQLIGQLMPDQRALLDAPPPFQPYVFRFGCLSVADLLRSQSLIFDPMSPVKGV